MKLLAPIVATAWLLPLAQAAKPASSVPADCLLRSGNDCENEDGTCVKVKSKCYPVDGTGQEGASCMATLTVSSSNDLIYTEVYGFGCSSGLTCDVAGAENANMVDVNITGVCQPEDCIGKKIPGNCNGNDPSNPECIAATERVTICHRTCSAKNPWVRITIDEDAWDGEGCGHKLQHDIRDECANKAPWTEWGVNRKDYLIKRHGTRQNVSDAFGGNTAKIKAYWRQWEPACPYVRNGACCDWDDAENPCCGEPNPQPIIPTVDIEKYAGPPGTCGVDMSQQADYIYTLPTPSSEWAYCYVFKVPDTSDECLINMKFNDPSAGGIDGWKNLPNSTMCPGDREVYVEGPTNPGSLAPQGCGSAVVKGTGDLSRMEATDSDCAGVAATPDPQVTIKKFGGPPGSCPVDMDPRPHAHEIDALKLGLQDLSYTTEYDWKFQFCYVMTNVGNECLLSANMTDLAPKGAPAGGLVDFSGKWCPGETKIISGPDSTSDADGEPSVPARVCGKGEMSNKEVCSEDGAAIITPPTTPEVIITKYGGPWDSCPVDMRPHPTKELIPGLSKGLQDVSYYAGVDWKFQFCYVMTNTGKECLLSAYMTDPAPKGAPDGGKVTFSEKWCPGETKIISGPNSISDNDGELPVDATVCGTGEVSGNTVCSNDDAMITVASKNPSVSITKFAGPRGSCPVDMKKADGTVPHAHEIPATELGLEDVSYFAEDYNFEYCYVLENTGDECLLSAAMTDVAPKGSGYTLPGEWCPGKTVIVQGPESTSGPGGEPSDLAQVCGIGVHSSQKVCDEDGAAVTTPSTCPFDMPNPGSKHCPDKNGVVRVRVNGADEKPSDLDIIYGISSPNGGKSVTFSVDNPFTAAMKMYVQYHAPSGTGDGWREACDDADVGECGDMPAITADCLYGDGKPYTLIQVYFYDGTDSVFTGGAEVDECCENKPAPGTGAVAQYSFLLRCECPTESRRLGQRDEEMDIEAILALFEK